ncbi:Cell shape-determining protein MreC [Candidatus Providencia siddallii]|uniref:Cell shape-determining protein MreC n=1 Tax=Candidatus Providencia siddallii TaxID=1715285 RepID=A0A0M6W8C6_9GAMM|nr:Cell shape-determining protein MreC [Candidatus Providencia siddallii]
MKSIFRRDPSFQLRVFFAVIFALILIVVDYNFKFLNLVRSYLNTLFNPFYLLSNSPRKLIGDLSENFFLKKKLQFENKLLRKELFIRKANNLLFDQIKQENSRLRELLGSPLRKNEHVVITQVISRVNTPYRDQVLIDKGSNNGVFEGQVVISDKGVIGQVVSVSKFNSRVLLICDASHALPVQVLRNDVRIILLSSGCVDNILFGFLPEHVDIYIGDVLVTSSLGGRFPEGYPVGIVSNINHDIQRAQTIINVKPSAELQRLRYLLLLWDDSNKHKTTLLPYDINKAANERLMNSVR